MSISNSDHAPTMLGRMHEVPHGWLKCLDTIGVPTARIRWTRTGPAPMSKRDEKMYAGAWGAPKWACALCAVCSGKGPQWRENVKAALRRGLVDEDFRLAVETAGDLGGWAAIAELILPKEERKRREREAKHASQISSAEKKLREWTKKVRIAERCALKWEKKVIRMRALASARKEDDESDAERSRQDCQDNPL